MPYEIRRGRMARQDIRDFIRHLKREASESIAQKYFEELELELRYGQPYQEYKIGVPFLLPNLMARRTAAK